MATYPGAIISLPNHSDTTDTIFAADINTPNAEIVAIETGLLNGFQHDLLPLTDATRSLGSSSKKWLLNGVVLNPTAYTPVWGNTGTANTLGNGSIVGSYFQIGKLVRFTILLTLGSTSSVGSGIMTLTLPVTSDVFGAGGATAIFSHTGVATYFGLGLTSSTTIIALIDNAKPGVSVTATSPFTWGAADTIYIVGTYGAA